MDSLAPCPAVWGSDEPVPVLSGGRRRFINLDNAASTPALNEVRHCVDDFLLWYGSVHRGAGFKSRLATEALEAAREIVLQFVGADPQVHTAIFTRNTTEAINRLAQMLPLRPGDVVLLTGMEHHANDLPWRARGQVEYVGVTDSGELDLADLAARLQRHRQHVPLVSVTGASNVTGVINPIGAVARLAHEHGARILVDAAQLAPHRAICMAQPDPAECIDFLALSGHKMYAPFGAGALIAPTDFLRAVEPDQRGGGAIKIVTHDAVYLADVPDRVEPGTPNTVGIIAMARAMQTLMALGQERLAAHEQALVAYALTRLQGVPGLHIYGSSDPGQTQHRVGVIPFNLGQLPHGLVAAILSTEGAVGVRDGCFCAHPYVTRLLGVDPAKHIRAVLAGDRSRVPGMVRVSFGLYNTTDDVDGLVEMLQRIARGEYDRGYEQDPASGDWDHRSFRPDYRQYFPFGVASPVQG